MKKYIWRNLSRGPLLCMACTSPHLFLCLQNLIGSSVVLQTHYRDTKASIFHSGVLGRPICGRSSSLWVVVVLAEGRKGAEGVLQTWRHIKMVAVHGVTWHIGRLPSMRHGSIGMKAVGSVVVLPSCCLGHVHPGDPWCSSVVVFHWRRPSHL